MNINGKSDRAPSATDPTKSVDTTDWTRLLLARSNPDAERLAAEAMALSVAGMLQVAFGLASSGRPIDLSGLSNHFGRLAAGILDLEIEQGRLLRPALIDLLSGLDRLEHVLRSRAPPGVGGLTCSPIFYQHRKIRADT